MAYPRFRVRTLMLAVAIVAVLIAARDHALEAYDACRFRKGWDSRDVEGEVSAIDRQGGRVTICLGSADGIVSGEVLYLFRKEPEVRYLGKIRIVSAEDESAVGEVVAGFHGPAIQEGDGVAHFTWVYPRKHHVCGGGLSASM